MPMAAGYAATRRYNVSSDLDPVTKVGLIFRTHGKAKVNKIERNSAAPSAPRSRGKIRYMRSEQLKANATIGTSAHRVASTKRVVPGTLEMRANSLIAGTMRVTASAKACAVSERS